MNFTEGFRFSRASYLLSLLRPVIIEELKLKEHGLRYHIRNPNSFTPIRYISRVQKCTQSWYLKSILIWISLLISYYLYTKRPIILWQEIVVLVIYRSSKESLLLGLDMKKNQEEIGKFSKADAEVRQ